MKELRGAAKTGYAKWLASTKFQVFIIASTLIFISQEIFELPPEEASGDIATLGVAYMGARILEPIVRKLTELKGKKRND